jgi:hypothetical protein
MENVESKETKDQLEEDINRTTPQRRSTLDVQSILSIPKNMDECLAQLMKSENISPIQKDQVKESDRVTIHLKAAGNAPILQNNKIKLGGFNKFISISEYLKNSLKRVIKDNDSLVLFCILIF